MSTRIEFHTFGPPSVMTAAETDPGRPGPGEVRVRQTAVGVNYLDVYDRRGDFGGSDFPAVTGFEAAGKIEEVGPEVSGFRSGDRVAYQLVKGAYAEARVMSVDFHPEVTRAAA